jgi:hypothetical protein
MLEEIVMPTPLAIGLSPAQRAELEWLRDHDPTPYLRERAAAILQVASGQSLRAVGQCGLLRPRRRETVGRWVRRYLADGPAGLRVRPGRGRKPAFFPPDDGGGTHGGAGGAASRAAPRGTGAQPLAPG